MGASSSLKLCCEIISWAFQRCRVSEQLCRVSVVLKSSLASSSLVQISSYAIISSRISDTGVGSCLEEFQDMEVASDSIRSGNWGANSVLCLFCSLIILLPVQIGTIFESNFRILLAGLSDKKIRNCQMNFREHRSDRKLTHLPSNLKNGVKFRHGILEYLSSVSFYLQMLVLKIPNITSELVVEQGVPGSRFEYVYPAIEENVLTFPSSSIKHLQSGLEEYVLKHGNNSLQKEHLKVGAASCSSESHKHSGLTMEAVVIISEAETVAPSNTHSSETQVLYYENFKPSSMARSSLTALSSLDWKSYGLTLWNAIDQDGCLLHWDNLQSNHPELSPRRKTEPDKNVVKKAVKLAMDDLKEKNPGLLLTERSIKIRGYAPDLARSIAGLITSSIDRDFQEECFTLLSLQSDDIGSAEDCIREKLVSVIEANDRNPSKSKDAATSLFGDHSNHERGNGYVPFVLEDESFHDSYLHGNEYEVEEDGDGDEYSEMDLTN
ncbi:Type 2 DNA topoisomerase 6 subunit B-like [Linum perenne]